MTKQITCVCEHYRQRHNVDGTCTCCGCARYEANFQPGLLPTLPELIDNFRRLHPELRVELHIGYGSASVVLRCTYERAALVRPAALPITFEVALREEVYADPPTSSAYHVRTLADLEKDLARVRETARDVGMSSALVEW